MMPWGQHTEALGQLFIHVHVYVLTVTQSPFNIFRKNIKHNKCYT